MILSILSLSSHGFTFCFSKRPRTNKDVFFTYKPKIITLTSQYGTPSQQSSRILPSNKVHHRAFPGAYGALEQPPLNRDLTPSSEALEQPPLNRDLTLFFGALKQSTPFV